MNKKLGKTKQKHPLIKSAFQDKTQYSVMTRVVGFGMGLQFQTSVPPSTCFPGKSLYLSEPQEEHIGTLHVDLTSSVVRSRIRTRMSNWETYK